MSAPEEIHELVERFDRNIDTYRSGRYNEAQVRQEFINSGGFFTKLFFKSYLFFVLRSQRKGAQMFVENVKWLLENDEHNREIYMKPTKKSK